MNLKRKTACALAAISLLGILLLPVCRTNLRDPAPPQGMSLIPAGTFIMGNTTTEYEPIDLPLQRVHVDSFFIDKREVTWSLWREVRDWAVTNGYAFENEGKGLSDAHPVHSVNWFDCVKWCNALSEGEGRQPAYYTDAACTRVYRTGQADPVLETSTSGYRLPTEAEWEKAARGGLAGLRFPWGDLISHTNANYLSMTTNNWSYDASPTKGCHPDYGARRPATSPAGSFLPNGYGLHDTSGNVAEWCWDRYGGPPAQATSEVLFGLRKAARNPLGPDDGRWRVTRGGSWISSAHVCRTSDRQYASPDYKYFDLGFRTVLQVR